MKDFRKIIGILIGAIAVIAFLRFTAWGHAVENAAREMLIRISYVGYGMRRSVVGQNPAYASSTVNEAVVEMVEKENESLRAMLDFKAHEPQKTVGAEVRGRSDDPSRATCVIDRGSADGLAIGAPVVVGSGVLVGVLQEVYEHSALVRLLSDPQSRVAGRLLNDTQTEGVITGGHGIVVRMELVPRSEKIAEGTLLVTSGLDAQIPRGLSIGMVRNTEPDVNSLFQRVIIEPPIDYSTLQFVLVGTAK